MVSSYFRYWGKALIQDEKLLFHPLVYHSLDVAAVGQELAYNYKPCANLAANLSLSLEEFASFFTFLLTLHDLGKFAISFQSQIVTYWSPYLVLRDFSKPYLCRHDTLGFWLWKNTRYRFFELVWEADAKNSDSYKSIINQAILSVTGHHGLPPGDKPKLLAYFNEKDIEAVTEFILDLKNLEFFPKRLPAFFGDKAYKQVFALASWRLNAIAVLADWLGSNRDIFNYVFPETSLENYWDQHAQVKAKLAIKNAGLSSKIKTEKSANNRNFLPHINELTPLQKYCNEVEIINRPQLFVLEDVTGSGKTEAALILAKRMISQELADGFYIGLPTMATANAMYERISEIYKSFFTKDSNPSVILSHGKRHLSDKFNQALELIRADFGDEEEGTATYWCNRWFADNRKKSLLADVGIGTLDQALASVLPYKHQTLRQLGLHNKILIADEVHAYDKYTATLLSKLIENHAKVGGNTIILSATLSQRMRQEFITAFSKGIDAKGHLQANNFKDFPLVTHIDRNKSVPNETPIETRAFCKRTIKIEILSNESLILDTIAEALQNGRCVAWIRNTVKDVRNAYQLVKDQLSIEDDKIILFHSRFAMVDRLRIEDKVIEHFGKNSTYKLRGGYLLISTQVIEQSLDIDMDLLVSDIAPIDLLIQRMGRLHRHLRDIFGNVLDGVSNLVCKRENPIFYVYAPPFEENPEGDWLKKALPGTQAVYEDIATIWLTQKLLMGHDKINFPEQARFLIESVYGEERNKIPLCFEKKSNEFEGKKRSEGSIANFNCIELENGYSRQSNLYGWDSEVITPTRLGNEKSEISLVVDEGSNLQPYAAIEKFPLDMSSLLVYENEEKVLCNLDSEWDEKLKSLRKQCPSFKNYTLIVPMIFNKEDNKYYIKGKNNQLIAKYCSRLGLQLGSNE